MAVSIATVDEAESEILELLRRQDGPIAVSELTRQALTKGLDDPSIVSAIWFLIDRHQIKLTYDLKLVIR